MSVAHQDAACTITPIFPQGTANKSGLVAPLSGFTLRSQCSRQCHAHGRFVVRPAKGLIISRPQP